MTEREAWLYLAKAWDAARPDEDGVYFAVEQYDGDPSYGLCASIVGLVCYGMITEEMEYEMGDKIAVLPNRVLEVFDSNSSYKWPLSREGAAARAAFCRRMAAELDTNNVKGTTP